MRRDPALTSLSHDHHQALVVAQQLRRSDVDSAAGRRDGFLAFWTEHGDIHFQLEEQVLFPAYAGYGDAHHPLLARALCDHAQIRHWAHEVARQQTPHVVELHELGARLAEHVRLEERQLFPLIEAALPEARLAQLAAELEGAEGRAGHG
jgi:hemerythrin-like domain-containing protein